jgi:hypothetical protein
METNHAASSLHNITAQGLATASASSSNLPSVTLPTTSNRPVTEDHPATGAGNRTSNAAARKNDSEWHEGFGRVKKGLLKAITAYRNPLSDPAALDTVKFWVTTYKFFQENSNTPFFAVEGPRPTKTTDARLNLGNAMSNWFDGLQGSGSQPSINQLAALLKDPDESTPHSETTGIEHSDSPPPYQLEANSGSRSLQAFSTFNRLHTHIGNASRNMIGSMACRSGGILPAMDLVRHRTDLAILHGYSGYTLSQEKNMKSIPTISALTLIAATVLGGCATNSPQQTSTPYSTPYQTDSASYGSIESIQVTHNRVHIADGRAYRY